MNGFYFKIYNGLLEPKHVKQMGESVWLYMWLNDKCTSVNENGEGKVLGNKPILFEEDIVPELGISRPTYARWVNKLRKADYIKTLRTPRGLVIVITKAKKFPSDVSQTNISRKKAKSDVSHVSSDVSKTSYDVSKSNIQYKTIQGYNKDTINNSTNVELRDEKIANEKEQISVLYFKVIKQLKLPTRNTTTVKGYIKKMQAEDQHQANINYLTFMLNNFADAIFEFKPNVDEATDVYTKRNKIITNVKRAQNQKGKTINL